MARNLIIIFLALCLIALLGGTIFLTASHPAQRLTLLGNIKKSIDRDVGTSYSTTLIESTTSSSSLSLGYILAGGQNGTCFTEGQYPQLFQVSLKTRASRKLYPVNDAEGTVWGGGWNGSEFLISGWGQTGGEPNSPNPYFYFFNGNSEPAEVTNDSQESEWSGGDIFSASYNGSAWLVSGMGSGILANYDSQATNHLSTGLVSGSSFTDLSPELPEQMDGILYANVFNGSEWLVGGGYEYMGVLFGFNGTSFTNLTPQLSSSILSFNSVQSIAWNGKYWLIGGIGFLAMYNGSTFTDLTSQLSAALAPLGDANPSPVFFPDFPNAVNSIAWNGTDWLLGGGFPIGINGSSSGWLAQYNPATSTFANLSSELPRQTFGSDSSILSIASDSKLGSWIIGGYARGTGLLAYYDGSSIADWSSSVTGSTYINWVGFDP